MLFSFRSFLKRTLREQLPQPKPFRHAYCSIEKQKEKTARSFSSGPFFLYLVLLRITKQSEQTHGSLQPYDGYLLSSSPQHPLPWQQP